MDNTEDILKNYRGKYSQFWIERWGLIPELPTSFDNANSIYELVSWLQRAFKNLLDDFQQLESEFEDFKNALIDLLEYLIPELIRRYSNSAEFRALFIILLEDILAGEERNWVKDLLKELIEVDMRYWFEDYLKELYDHTLKDFFDKTTAQLAQTTGYVNSNPINVKSPQRGLTGALGDGVSDDTNSLKNILNYAEVNGIKHVYFPSGTYLITSPLKVPAGMKIEGDGTTTILKKVNTAGLSIDGTIINSVLILEGYKTTLEDFMIEGSIDNTVNGITFSKDTAMVTINRLGITFCKRALHEFKSLWIAEFNKVHINSCEEAFVLRENIGKTALTFKNCWAENCGQSYQLYRVSYSSLINCGADWNSYLTNSPYGKGYGNQDTYRGVYDLELCRGVSIISCGAENCYGNGFVRVEASDITITGFTGYFLKSDYVPNNNDGVGFITTGNAKVTLNVSSIYFQGFTNDKIASESPNTPVSLIANNYSVGGYGQIDRKMIIVNSIITEAIKPIFDGANGSNNCLYVPTILDKPSFKDYITLGSKCVFSAKKLLGSGNKIMIPILPNTNANIPHMITIRGIDGSYNSVTPKSFVAHIEFTSYIGVERTVVLDGSTEGVTATGINSNLVITLPKSYTDGVIVECSVISSTAEFVNFLSATLN